MKQEQTQQSTQTQQTPQTQPYANKREEELRRVHRCANCDIEFLWSPTIVQGKVYCCTGCAAGGPCNCDYSLYRSVTIMGEIHYEL